VIEESLFQLKQQVDGDKYRHITLQPLIYTRIEGEMPAEKEDGAETCFDKMYREAEESRVRRKEYNEEFTNEELNRVATFHPTITEVAMGINNDSCPFVDRLYPESEHCGIGLQASREAEKDAMIMAGCTFNPQFETEVSEEVVVAVVMVMVMVTFLLFFCLLLLVLTSSYLFYASAPLFAPLHSS
jgi:hypothetical protein